MFNGVVSIASVVIPPFDDALMSGSADDAIVLSCAFSDKVENSKTAMVVKL